MTLRSERCIECEELELARVSDLAPSQMLAIPHDALGGLPSGRSPLDLTRRRLLQGGVAGMAAVYGASRTLGLQEVFETAVAEADGPQKCVVMIYLAGGNDGLNVVLPGSGASADYGAYKAARPSIGRGQGASSGGTVGSRDVAGLAGGLAWANPVVSSAGGGDNGAAYGFDTLWGDGGGGAGSNLALMPASDAIPTSLSHFDSTDHWFEGTSLPRTTGWLGRWLDRNGSATNPLQGVSIDTGLSKALRTSVNPVCAIPSTSNLGFTLNPSGGYGMPSGAPSKSDANAAMAALAAVASTSAATSRSRAAYGQATQAASSGAVINATAKTMPTYPANSTLATKLQLAARILSAGLGTRVVTIHWGGFDTHGNQVATQDKQLAEFSSALGAFTADLTARGIESNVATLVFSEFGRRVGENGSQGTDHGYGGLMLVSGSGVRGGLCSEFPGCTANALSSGNLKVTTDYRSVYQAILREWLGGDLTDVLPDGEATPLQRHDGTNGLFR